MTALGSNPYWQPYLLWAQAVDDAVRRHLAWVDAQYRVGVGVLTALRGKSAKRMAASAQSDTPQTLEERAIARMHRGLPPPREVYDVQNRARVDWTSAPDWARPVDPELFEGCGHEG
jgi:hypothetical protein